MQTANERASERKRLNKEIKKKKKYHWKFIMLSMYYLEWMKGNGG